MSNGISDIAVRAGGLVAAGGIAFVLAGGALAGGVLVAGALLLAASDLRATREAEASERGETVAALRALVSGSEALRPASESLAALPARFEALDQTWSRSHEQAIEQTVVVVRDGLTQLRSELKTGIEDAARASKEAVAPLLRESLGEASAVVEARLGALLEKIEHDSAERSEHELRLLERVGESADRFLSGAADQLRVQSAETSAQAFAQLGEVATQQALQRASQEQESREALESQLRSSDEERSERLRQLAETLVSVQQEQLEAQRARFENFTQELRSQVEGALQQIAEREGERGNDWLQGLDAQRQVLHEAAELVHAGGVELSSTAEAFGQALDRHQESAREWLVGLGEAESRLDAAGEQAAARALEEKLGETQALFARQLEFQRELYEQLRALRGDPVTSSSSSAPVAFSPESFSGGSEEAAVG